MLTQAALFGVPAVAYCQRCHRPLSNPTSTQRGIGPICYGKHRKDITMDASDFGDKHLDIPLDEGIHLRRDPAGRGANGQTWTNVPHLVVHHSPTGFEWGYGGSGPADLALNIAEAMLQRMNWRGERMQNYDGTCYKMAWQLHQDLKRTFIAPMDEAGGVIAYETLKSWIVGRCMAMADEIVIGLPQPDDLDYGQGETPTD